MEKQAHPRSFLLLRLSFSLLSSFSISFLFSFKLALPTYVSRPRPAVSQDSEQEKLQDMPEGMSATCLTVLMLVGVGHRHGLIFCLSCFTDYDMPSTAQVQQW